MAGEFEKEPESTRARLTQHAQQQTDSLHEYQRAQYTRIAAPTTALPIESYDEYRARLLQEQSDRDARIGARDLAMAHAAKQALDGPSSPMIGGPMPVGNPSDGGPQAGALHTMSRAPGKMFARSDILAILKAQHALALKETSTAEWKAAKNNAFQDLFTIFENLE